MECPCPIYAPLYKKGNVKNQILEWKISIQPHEKEGYNIITHYGKMHGNLIEKVVHIAKGKANRTALQQTIQEANRRFQDKKEKENYNESPDMDDSKIEMRPMLAQTFTFEQYNKPGKHYKMKFPLYVQPKLDGIRCIAHYIPGSRSGSRSQSSLTMLSRKGTQIYNFEHIENVLKEYFDVQNCDEIYIDGELYSHDLTFEKISSIVRSQKLSAHNEIEIEKIQYNMYDVYVPKYPELTYEERYAILCHLFENEELDFCNLVETECIETIDEIKPMHQKYVEDGYEGIMLRDMDGIYEIDKRSKYLQKYKTFMEEEFEIIGFTDEDGMILFQCITQEGKDFSVRPRDTFENRKKMYEEGEKYIGKYLTVIFQEYTELHIPRFPVGKAVRDYE